MMEKLLLLGDPHASFSFVKRSLERARLSGCDAVVALGDWGAHWQTSWSKAFTDSVKEALADSPIPLFWLRGNHDNAAFIAALLDEAGGALNAPIEISPNYYYLPDGLRWDVGGATVGVLGGEFSVDHRDRSPYVTWWPEELPSAVAVESLGHDPVDLLLTHGPPDLPGNFTSSWRLPPQDQDKQDVARILIRRAIKQTAPPTLVHGHLHHRYDEWYPFYGHDGSAHDAEVVGLANGDRTPYRDAVAVYDLTTKHLVWPLPSALDVDF